MALISKFGVDDVYKQLKGEFRSVRARSVQLRAQSAAGPISFSTVREYFATLTGSIALMSDRVSRFGASTLIAYAVAQEDVQGYNVAADYAAMINAANAVVDHISSALPPNSVHAISNGQVIEPTFPTDAAAMVTLRSLLNSLIGTIGAP